MEIATTAPEESPPTYNLDPALVAQVEALLGKYFPSDQPGAAVMVIRDGQIAFQGGFGLADAVNKTPLTPQTLFHTGSVGKQFTALGVMMLAERGLLDYDDPVGNYLPELVGLGEGITIQSLLHHTSGIPDYYEDKALNEALFELSDQPTNADTLHLLATTGQPLFPPGEHFAYSNTGYEVLGSLIEAVTGLPYPEFMRQRIFDPLGMIHTFSLPDPTRFDKPHLAHSYTQGLSLYDSDPLDNLVGSGSFYSSLEDFYFYDQALYGDRLVSQASLSEAWAPGVLNSGETTKYGFAWFIDSYRDQLVYWHTGSWLAFKSLYTRMPRQKLSILILTNRDYDLPDFEAIARQLFDWYYPVK